MDPEMELELIYFKDPDTGEETPFFVLEQTCVAGINYLLVAEDEEDDSYGYILREIQTDEEDVIYEVVEDEEELRAISQIFSELIDDIDLDCD